MEQIHETRRRNVEHLIATGFDGNVSAFARAVGKPHSQIFRCLRKGGKNSRPFGEKQTREIERKLGFPEGLLDNPRAEAEPPKQNVHSIFGNERVDGLIDEMTVEDMAYFMGKLSPDARRAIEYTIIAMSSETNAR